MSLRIPDTDFRSFKLRNVCQAKCEALSCVTKVELFE
jgi:hypothetical protein